MYDWPDFVNRYANFTDRDHRGHGVEFPQWTQNYGAGRALRAEIGEYKTSQFGLYKLMYERLLLDPRRTNNPQLATTFVIPYDFGMDAIFTMAHGRNRRTQCPLAPTASDRLLNSTFFARHYGHDHLLIVSSNQNMNYFFSAKPCTDFFHLCWNCTKVAIDEYMFIAQNRPFELKNRGINWHAVPFPSDFHYDDRPGVAMPWEQQPSSSLGFSSTSQHHITAINMTDSSERNRSTIVSLIGNPRKYSVVSTKIRLALLEQCSNHTVHCRHETYSHDAKSRQKSGSKKDIAGANDVALHSIFCLQPPGDMPTRKSVFDVILAGCVPVFFHPLTARIMYEWHLGQKKWEKIGYHFDSMANITDLTEHRLDVIRYLVGKYEKHPGIVKRKQNRIRSWAHQLQYSLIYDDPSNQQHLRNVSRKIVTVHGKRREVLDAYDTTMENVLVIHAGIRSHDRTSAYAYCETMGAIRAQTAEWCNVTNSNIDPFGPPASVESYFYKKDIK